MSRAVLRQWRIPSSTGRGTYTVTRTAAGWECSCPAWAYRSPRRDCKHIAEARDNAEHDGAPPVDWPRLVRFAAVACVTATRDAAGRLVKVRVPLQPVGPEWTDFLATVAHDLDALGMPWREVQKVALLARTNPRDAVRAHVRRVGRVVHDRWVDGRGWVGRRTVPVPAAAAAPVSPSPSEVP